MDKLKDAELALKKALQIKPKDPVASGNLKILQYLRKHGGTYWNYLERSLDRAEIKTGIDGNGKDVSASPGSETTACQT